MFKPKNPQDIHINILKFFGSRPEIDAYMKSHVNFDHSEEEYLYQPFTVTDVDQEELNALLEKGEQLINYIDLLSDNFTHEDHIHTRDIAKAIYLQLNDIVEKGEGKIKLDNPEVFDKYRETVGMIANSEADLSHDFFYKQDVKATFIVTGDMVKTQLHKIQHVDLGFLIPSEVLHRDNVNQTLSSAFLLKPEELANYPQYCHVTTEDDYIHTRHDVPYDTIMTVVVPTKYPLTTLDMVPLLEGEFNNLDLVIYTGDSSKAAYSTLTVLEGVVEQVHFSKKEPPKEEIIDTLDTIGMIEPYLHMFGWEEEDLDDSHDDEDVRNAPSFGVY